MKLLEQNPIFMSFIIIIIYLYTFVYLEIYEIKRKYLMLFYTF